LWNIYFLDFTEVFVNRPGLMLC